MLSSFYQTVFGVKTYKLALDAGCTCPNRDGTKGSGGCIFCSQAGSGDFVSSRSLPVAEQVMLAKQKVESKMRGRTGERRGKYIAYFQNFSSTYGDPQTLLKKYSEALKCPDVEGLAVATRPDCLNDEILAGLALFAKNHFVQIELGLQTSNEKTGQFINRCYTNQDYLSTVQKIKEMAKNIHIVTHLIFGLPGEIEKDMLESVSFVVKANCQSSYVSLRPSEADYFGIKITSLYIVENTKLAEFYAQGQYQPLEKSEYFALLKKTLPLLPENCVLHRLTGDPPKKILVSPLWPADKKRVINELKKMLNNYSQTPKIK